MLCVGDSVAADVLQEDLQHLVGLLADEARDALHAATASQTVHSRLGNSLDVVVE